MSIHINNPAKRYTPFSSKKKEQNYVKVQSALSECKSL